MPNKKNKPVHILDIIYEEDYIPELDRFPMFKMIDEITAAESCGIKSKYSEETIFYDVSTATPEFKEDHIDIIEEISIQDLITIPSKKIKRIYRKPNILSLVRLSDLDNLSPKELKTLGSDFYMIKQIKSGFYSVDSVITIKSLNEDLYLNVDLLSVDPVLSEKISGLVHEFNLCSNGLYCNIDEIGLQQKRHFS